MRAWGVVLFGTAGLFNLAVAAALAFDRARFVRLVGLDPITGSNVALAWLAASLIAAFGYAYLRVAQDPVRFRPYVHLGALGKLLVFGALVWAWREGHAPWKLPALGAADLVYALLFVAWLRRPGPRRL